MKQIETNKSPIYSPIEEYHLSITKGGFVYAVDITRRLILLSLGLYISVFILYSQVLFSTAANTIVTIFFCLMALICFEGFGVPISEFLNRT